MKEKDKWIKNFRTRMEGYSSFHKKDKTVQIHLVSYMISP